MERKTMAAAAADAIRKELKQKFPGIKFTVRSQTYAGGNSVDVEWYDGPLEKDVNDAVVSRYQYGHFDAMTDYYDSNNHVEGLPQVKYAFAKRIMSESVKDGLLSFINRVYNGCETLGYDDYSDTFMAHASTLVSRLFAEQPL